MSSARTHGPRPERPGSARRRLSGSVLVRSLNDPRRGALLDALIQARARLAGKTATGWEAETLAAVTDELLARLAALGIRPLRPLGERFALTARQLAGRFEYHGSPFRAGERLKHVLVAAPGWAVGRRTIVRPTVRELAAEERR